jgi:IclR family transcriptional regulator, acetate operon repressor
MARAERPAPDARPTHPIESVDRALRLLQMFRDTERIRIADASRALGVVPSTASRLMSTLQYHGFVVQDPETKAYRLGPVLLDLGLSVVRRMDVRRLVRPHLEQLAGEVDETVQLCLLDGNRVVFVDGIEGTRPVRTTLRTGMRREAHVVSAGKALLAELPVEELRRLYPEPKLTAYTEHSIAQLAGLERELDTVRARGYGTSIGESEPDIAGLGMTIHDANGKAVGAVSISIPMTRYTERALAALIDPLRRATTAASKQVAAMDVFGP